MRLFDEKIKPNQSEKFQDFNLETTNPIVRTAMA